MNFVKYSVGFGQTVFAGHEKSASHQRTHAAERASLLVDGDLSPIFDE